MTDEPAPMPRPTPAPTTVISIAADVPPGARPMPPPRLMVDPPAGPAIGPPAVSWTDAASVATSADLCIALRAPLPEIVEGPCPTRVLLLITAADVAGTRPLAWITHDGQIGVSGPITPQQLLSAFHCLLANARFGPAPPAGPPPPAGPTPPAGPASPAGAP